MLYKIIIDNNSWRYEESEEEANKVADLFRNYGSSVTVECLVPKKGERR